MLLSAWGNAWMVFELSHQTGDFRRHFARSSAARADSGLASVVWTLERGRVLAAVYHYDGRVWLRLADQCICLAEQPLTVEHELRRHSCVASIRIGALPVVTYTYSAIGQRIAGWIDPTYDELDREHDDFFLYLSHVGGLDWQQHVRTRWQDGKTAD